MQVRLSSGIPRVAGAGARLALVALAATAVTAAPAHAVAKLTVSPLIIDVSLAPGEKIVRAVTVTASGDDPLRVEFQHADFGFTERSYALTLVEDSSEETVQFSTRGWFTTPKRRYRIASGKSIQVPVTITVPENATPGTHLGAAFFRTSGSPGAGGSTRILTAARAGPLVFVAIRGGARPGPVLRRFELPWLLANGPMRPVVRIDNDGDTHYRMTGTVSLRGGDTNDKITLPERYVMPDLPRSVLNETGHKLKLGSGTLPTGRYRVRIEVRTDPGQKRIVASRTVWVIPWWLRGIVALAAAAVLAGIVWGVVQWRDRRRIRRMLHDTEILDELEDGDDLGEPDLLDRHTDDE